MNLEEIMPLSYWAIALVAVLCIVEFIWIVILQNRLKGFQKSYLALQTFLDGSSLDQQLKEYISGVNHIKDNVEKMEKRMDQVELKLRSSIDRAELVRFNAFDNMGSDLSFALALLNQQGDGVVLSSINNREESRVYAKPISHGESSYHLSQEEKAAIGKAKETIKI
ncbi:uncharacterized protein DUF4446 [Desulfitobacterium sp. LBE]|uniref:DUF4446 domain-containing protein n=1 Tax=Desulfitobacterium chlororespirans DSM 11544 TaxID=1121395 RepID=A0A1M7TFW6_9FIRM|nr:MULTISPECIES: DUF4446 family protein [Desulfitobacterium]TWH59024.1 uncharacterized protein DUF4446 [Desulfitobacterium sp. LBE]SHN69595.1 Protein of unknown function [Desulfitobacterium chlororespirans DSM 11544]